MSDVELPRVHGFRLGGATLTNRGSTGIHGVPLRGHSQCGGMA